ncbi:hypothetical protein PG993_010775 [Apiospora rasikravindrae]|uniref:Uncharacterized protein n=1 Tax=Apiospora rasikravindrae TaxID=990691 RepID=A0ABR1SCD2_9PEZI
MAPAPVARLPGSAGSFERGAAKLGYNLWPASEVTKFVSSVSDKGLEATASRAGESVEQLRQSIQTASQNRATEQQVEAFRATMAKLGCEETTLAKYDWSCDFVIQW